MNFTTQFQNADVYLEFSQQMFKCKTSSRFQRGFFSNFDKSRVRTCNVHPSQIASLLPLELNVKTYGLVCLFSVMFKVITIYASGCICK